MQNCTRTCAKPLVLNSVAIARVFAIICLVMFSGLKAEELKPNQSLASLDENQDPGWQSTRSLSVSVSVSDTALQAGLININSANVDELASALPGIGPGKAQRIVDWRNTNGAFQFIEQLLEVNGIGPKTLERITAYIYVGEAGESMSTSQSRSPSRSPIRDPENRLVLLDIVRRANKDAVQAVRELGGS